MSLRRPKHPIKGGSAPEEEEEEEEEDDDDDNNNNRHHNKGEVPMMSPSYHGMVRPQFVDGRTACNMDGSCECIE